MTLTFELYWSFRSPYSYLAVPRLLALTKEFDVRCVARPVYPHAVRAPHLFAQRPPQWLNYFRIDVARTAAFLDLPIAWPRPDPVSGDPQTGAAFGDQPLIWRLTRLGVAAEARGRGLAFLYETSRLLWAPETADWTAPGLLAGAAARAGLDLDEMEQAIAADPKLHDDAIAQNQMAEDAAGHWGVPLMAFEGEPFFGQDRIDQLIWRMQARGLRPRAIGEAA